MKDNNRIFDDYMRNRRPDVNDDRDVSRQTTVVGDLLARIAELEKLAVMWHKFPEEKPTKARMYAIAYRKNGETIYGYSIWHTTTSSWHKNTNDLDIVAWWKFPKLSSELTKPAPPEEQ